jgi:hypothetical protein
MKRFTDTEKWADPWFRELSPVLKCLWSYLCDRCDNAGVWKVDKSLAEFQIGSKIKWEDATKAFGKRCVLVKEDRLLVIGFIDFQFGKLNENVNLHRNVLKLISFHGMAYPCDTHRGTDSMGYGIGIGIGIGNGLGEEEVSKGKKKELKKDFRDGRDKYLDWVYLSKDEYKKLLSEVGKDFLNKSIQFLDSYIENNDRGKKYVNHCKVFHSWVFDEMKSRGNQIKPCNPDDVAAVEQNMSALDELVKESVEEGKLRKDQLKNEVTGDIDLSSMLSKIGRNISGL